MSLLLTHIQERVSKSVTHASDVGRRGHRHRRLPVPAHVHRRLVRRRRGLGVRSHDRAQQDLDHLRAAAQLRRQGAQHRRRQGRRSRTRTGSARSTRRTSTPSSPTSPPTTTSSRCIPRSSIPPEQWKAYLEDRQGAIVGTRWPRSTAGRSATRSRCAARSIPATGTSTCAPSTTSTSKRRRRVDDVVPLEVPQREAARGAQGPASASSSSRSTTAPQSAAIGAGASTRTFANSPAETRTESEKAFQLEFLSMASALIERHPDHLVRRARHPDADPRQHDGDGDARAHHRVRGHARHRLSVRGTSSAWCSAKASSSRSSARRSAWRWRRRS